MNNNISRKYTFSGLIDDYKIEIPIIQRDYAQGRARKEKLREKFLTNLHDAITTDKGSLELDFVYGDVKKDVFYPLDGQQRLTTLFLLHWYIAVKNNELEAKEKLLSRFTYETRTSSREFCQDLVKYGVRWKEDDEISKLIEDSNWFFESWKKDPTIKSMLTMLNAIHEKFKNTTNLSWEALDDISFYFIELSNFGLSDDLYIKMNARGKQLTGFENFKAELVQHIKALEIDENDKPTETIAHKLDTTWTDIFWKNRSDDARIDEIYFAFINRFFLNQLITSKNEKDDFSFSAAEIEGHEVFKVLYGNEGDDKDVKYDGFDVYKEKIKEESLINKKTLESLAKTLDNFHSTYSEEIKSSDVTQFKDVNLAFLPIWDCESSFSFIPTYKNKEDSPKQSILKLEQKERIVFHAVCRFFEKLEEGKKDIETQLKQWIRIVWNIVENGGVNTVESMIRVMRLIDELSEHSYSIYEFLADEKNYIMSPEAMNNIMPPKAKEQVAEELEKARQIRKAIKYNKGPSEKDIKDAEETAFFKGTIRFLFTNELGEIDWEHFDNKHAWCDEHFDKTGVKDKYRKDALLLRAFISYVPMNKWRNLFDDLLYSSDANNWKSILINSVWLQEIDKMLTKELPTLDYLNKWNPDNPDPIHSLVLRDLVNSNLLSKISEPIKEDYRLNDRYFKNAHWYNRYMLYPSNTKAQRKMFMIGTKRNNILATISKEGQIKIDDWQIAEGTNYFKGWDIHFTYKSHNFQWHRDGNIYMLNQEKRWIEVDNKYISIPEVDVTTENFTEKLDELIKEFNEASPQSTPIHQS